MLGCLASPNKLSHPRIHHFFLRPGLSADPAALSDPTQGSVGKAGPQMLMQLLPKTLAACKGSHLLGDQCWEQKPAPPPPTPPAPSGKDTSLSRLEMVGHTPRLGLSQLQGRGLPAITSWTLYPTLPRKASSGNPDCSRKMGGPRPEDVNRSCVFCSLFCVLQT